VVRVVVEDGVSLFHSEGIVRLSTRWAMKTR